MKFNNLKLLSYLKVIIFISSIFYFIYFIFENLQFFLDLQKIKLDFIFLVLILKILNILFLSNINLRILNNLKINLNFMESFEITIKNTLGNLSSPLKLGSGYKITYLKEHYKLEIKNYILLNTFFSILNLIPIFLIFILYNIFNSQVRDFKIVGIVTIISFLVTLFLIVFQNFQFLKTLKIFSKNNLHIHVNNILFFLSNTFIVYIIANQLLPYSSFFSALAFTSLGFVVNLVNLTPGNIGIKESVLFIFENIHGYSLYLLIFISFLERFISLITLFSIQFCLKYFPIDKLK